MIRYLVTSFGYAEETDIAVVPWTYEAPSFSTPEEALTSFFEDMEVVYNETHASCGHDPPEGANYCPLCGRYLLEEDRTEKIVQWLERTLQGKIVASLNLFGSEAGYTSWVPWDIESVLEGTLGEVLLVYETGQLFAHFLETKNLKRCQKVSSKCWKTSFWT